MDDFLLFWVLVFLVGMVLFFGVPFLTFFILKKIGKPKAGKIIGLGVLTIFSMLVIYVVFEDQFFFKNSARKELKQMDLVLNEDFEIIKNESGGFKDYYHIFELKISVKDINRLTKFKALETNPITIARKNIESNVWKEVKVDKEKGILTYEYIIN